MNRLLRGLFLVGCGLWLALSQPVAAQWTSAYPNVNVAGNFNGYETLTPNMQLISNGVWISYQTFSDFLATNTRIEALFATPSFTAQTWKALQPQTDFLVPIAATAASHNVGSDIVISNFANGILRFQLNEATRVYTISDVTPGSVAGELWINEFHYDNAGNDSNEMIEVAGMAGLSLTNYQVVLYNGGNGSVYSTTTLSGTLPNQLGGYGAASFSYAANGIQNGPDAIALVRRSPSAVLWFISYGGTFTAVGGPADGLTPTNIGLTESGTLWDYSLQLTGNSGDYPGFTWVGPTNRSPGQMNAGQNIVTGAPAVSVSFSNLVHSPSINTETNTVHVDVDISPIQGATNITATTFYRTSSTNRFLPLAMSRTGNHHRTISPIPAQPSGTTVEYYIFTHYTGNGTNSPDVYPSTAPTVVPSYTISRSVPGAVWINEINPSPDPLGSDTEFLELVGLAGTDISGWRLEIYQFSNSVPQSTFTIPPASLLPNQVNGFGFYVFGHPDTPNVDFAWATNSTDRLPATGGVRLYNETSNVVYALYWNVFGAPTPWDSFTYIGFDDDFDPEFSLSLNSAAGNSYDDFTWESQILITPGAENDDQALVGGNTNNLPPLLICPSNLFLSCAGDSIPTSDVSSVTATGLCGNGSVTVTVSSVTNGGSGCFGNPKIVTRTYRAVSDCSTTSECVQIIRVEDVNPPVMSCGAAGLINPGFEFSEFTGWTTFGAGFDNLSIASLYPRSGFRHALLRGSISSVMADTSGNALNGFYFGQPLRGQAGVSGITSNSVRFNGTNQYAEVSQNSLLNGDSFSFAFWMRAEAPSNFPSSLLCSREFSISEVSGYQVELSTTNRTLQFRTGDGVFWDVMSGPNVAIGTWVHVAGSVSNGPGTASKRLWVNGSLIQQKVITNYLPNTVQPLRLAAGTTESTASEFFAGRLDEVRLYDFPLSSSQVTSLYNNGLGGINLGSETGLYPMNDPQVSGVSTSGFFQALPASTGQIFTASAWAYIPGSDPLKGSNRGFVTLSYLNGSGTVLATYTSAVLTSSSPSNRYIRLAARGAAPLNTATTRLTTVFNQDAAGSRGTIYFDDAILSTLVVLASNTCPTMPNVLSLVSATDTCAGAVTITQTPPLGAVLAVTNETVTFRATDACGLVSTCVLDLVVVDDIAPVITCPTNFTVSCTNLIPVPTPQSISATDNCGVPTVTFDSDTYISGNICSAAAPYRVHRLYRATDLAGNSTICTQQISVVDTNPPALNCTVAGPLVNAGFESNTAFQGWSQFGNNKFVVTIAPRSGVRHALIKGSGSVDDNYTGFYQDLTARSGQTWRISGYAMSPATNPVSGASTCEIKMEFLGPNGLLSTHLTPLITSATTPGVYLPYSASGTAPEGTTLARFTLVYIQRGGASGEVFLDDASLSQTLLSATGLACQAALPDLRQAVTATDCAAITATQTPAPGTLLGLGSSNVTLRFVDTCKRTSTCVVAVTVLDDVCTPAVPPAPTNVTVVGFTLSGTNITVRSLGTNSWSMSPEYTTNLVGQPQTWLPITSWTNTYNSGTNITSFQPPISNSAVLIRIWQKYP